MIQNRLPLAASVFSAVMLSLSHGEDLSASDREINELFTLKVLPMLQEKCAGCHDPAHKVKSGFEVTDREALLWGGDNFEDVLIPGDSSKSTIIDMVKWADPDWEMPPKENDRLTAEQIEDLATWIDAGAPWPSEEEQLKIFEEQRTIELTDDGLYIPTSGGSSDSWTFRRYDPETVWAFQPLEAVDAPFDHSDHPVDAFIQAKLAETEWESAPTAAPRLLARRLYHSVIGLPPTPEEMHRFLSAWDENPDEAWETEIDRLLASPHYGERWAQHWLDVARYADTGGLSNDYERSNMWRYRDYVIRAFNEDKPYDAFVMEQIAGDEMADRQLRERSADAKAFEAARQAGDFTPEESEWMVASSFLRIGPWDPAMVKVPDARQQYVDDVVNAVGQTFLSTTMRCFKCHDHKFDPLPHRDYYRMYSIFANTQLAERSVPFLEEETLSGFEKEKVSVERLYEFASDRYNQLVSIQREADEKWYAERGLEYMSIDERKDLPDEEKPPRLNGLDETQKGRHKVRRQDEWIWQRRLERFEPMVQSVYNGPDPGFLNARKLRISTKRPADWTPETHILAGGALGAEGDAVTPGVLSALRVATDVGSEEDPYALGTEVDGRRLGLARWITDPTNPLTARSIVNRVWQYHFGKPLAGNPNNFGVKGAPPTHPELLDWLAVDFVENGWTFKRLHRLILTSDTFRQSVQHPSYQYIKDEDPNNDLFAYFPTRRLSAEEMRDTMLAITGELNPDGGGLPARPEINMEVALQPRMIQFSLAPTYQPNALPEQRNRRSVYAYRVRGLANPFLETFNQPNPNDSCEARDSAAVSPQAFTLLNSDLMTNRSIAFAQRLESEASDLPEQIDRAFELALGRLPDTIERQKLGDYVTEMASYHEGISPEPREFPTEITQSLVEEFSGAPFDYTEILPVYENYTPDPSPADVSPQTRALADLCLILFNTNEFIYVY
ncbi:MAG: PSD1 and planctomycete cytochrome C domain-containing protein [Verrucomicrobiota bacterium]